MANTTGKKFGGRKKGTPNKDKRNLLDRLQEKFPGFCPLEKMCEMAVDETNDVNIRLTASKEVAQYVYPKLKSVEHMGEGGAAIEVQIVDYSKLESVGE